VWRSLVSIDYLALRLPQSLCSFAMTMNVVIARRPCAGTLSSRAKRGDLMKNSSIENSLIEAYSQ